eukprot:m.43590 g.43590  ORF g.43590 m.43590 type:complete len:111 (+) comp9985_c0_seq1:343-675(+)
MSGRKLENKVSILIPNQYRSPNQALVAKEGVIALTFIVILALSALLTGFLYITFQDQTTEKVIITVSSSQKGYVCTSINEVNTRELSLYLTCNISNVNFTNLQFNTDSLI